LELTLAFYEEIRWLLRSCVVVHWIKRKKRWK